MTQFQASDYHFCTLNELQSPKPLPSLNFVTKLVDICHVPNTLFESSQKNIYDRKNHILYINNYQAYSRTLNDKYGRTVLSFQKQLKMMGFKKRKIKQHKSQSRPQNQQQIVQEPIQAQNQDKKGQDKAQIKKENIFPQQQIKNRIFPSQTLQQQKNSCPHEKYMFVWRTNRSLLIQQELNNFQQALSQEVSKAIQLKQIMEKRKKQLDNKLETIIFQSLINCQEGDYTEGQSQMIPLTRIQKGRNDSEQILQKYLDEALKQLKLLSNQSQIQSTKFIKNISKNLGNELQLYRMLIYKQPKLHHVVEQEE